MVCVTCVVCGQSASNEGAWLQNHTTLHSGIHFWSKPPSRNRLSANKCSTNSPNKSIPNSKKPFHTSAAPCSQWITSCWLSDQPCQGFSPCRCCCALPMAQKEQEPADAGVLIKVTGALKGVVRLPSYECSVQQLRAEVGRLMGKETADAPAKCVCIQPHVLCLSTA